MGIEAAVSRAARTAPARVTARVLATATIAVTTLALFVPTARASRLSDIDAAAVESWADKTFGQALAERRFTGAAIVLVKQGEVLFSRGYGYADLRSKAPMDPDATLVRVCSNSKIFVATALMQLVDRGAIKSLDDAANRYLERIQLPAFAGQEITLRHLVTHRAGFEDTFFNAGTETVVSTPVDGATLKRLIPEIVRRPGTLSVYSNATAALQGAIIEDVSGLTLREYLARNVFAPLGMKSATLNDNPPAPPGHAQPYVLYSSGGPRPVELVAKHPVYAPSGGVYSTPQDMARFLTAHLDAGRTTSTSLLSPAAFATMHRLSTRNHPRLAGIGVQLFVDDIDGTEVLSHSCGLPGFSSYLALVPQSDVGFFITVVSARERAQSPLTGLMHCFVDPDEPVAPNFAAKFFYTFLDEFIGFGKWSPDVALDEDLSRYLGTYRPDRRAYTNILAALDLLAAQEATLVVRRKDGEPGVYISERGPFFAMGSGVLQRDRHPARTYAFDFDNRGRAVRMMWSSAQSATRVQFFDDPGFAYTSLMAIAAIALTGLLALFMPAGGPAGRRRAERWGRFVPPLLVLFLVLGWTFLKVGFDAAENIEDYINVGGTARLALIALAANLAVLAALLMALVAILSWRHGYWGSGALGIARRVHYSIVAAAATTLLPLFGAYRLLGLQLP